MMKIAVLPFNAAAPVDPALARQLGYFFTETLRTNTQLEIAAVNYLSQIQDSTPPQFINENPSESLNDSQILLQFFDQTGVSQLIDGLLALEKNQTYKLTYRYFEHQNPNPVYTKEIFFEPDQLFKGMQELCADIAKQFEQKLPEKLFEDPVEMFGTQHPEAFIQFMIGYDALVYIEKSEGRVAPDYSPKGAMEAFIKSLEVDMNWEGPYMGLVQLCRLSTQLRMGTPEDIEHSLKKLIELFPEDERAIFAIGEFYEAIGNLNQAAESFEKASQLAENEPAIYTRLGLVQNALGMPFNAEKNLKKAMELEGQDKPSADHLANILLQTDRAHEVPKLWKEMIDLNPQNPIAHAKYAISLIQTKQDAEALRAFDLGLEILEDSTPLKRYYASVLARKNEYDRAMDYFEDYLDANPTNVEALLEYAQTLLAAGRTLEAPKVLRDLLSLQIDPNLRAEITALLIELEQPKRIEALQTAKEQMDQKDLTKAIHNIQALKNWLSDYWKLWALLSSAYNQASLYKEAEEAARNLIQLYPNCEPAYAELAASMMGQGKDEEAYELSRYAITHISNSIPMAINLAVTAKRTGREEETASLIKQIREAAGSDQSIQSILAELEAPLQAHS